MSSSIACAPLKVAVRASRWELYFLILVHALALWGVMLSSFYWSLPVLVVSAGYYFWRWLRFRQLQLTLFHDQFCWLENGPFSRQYFQLGRRHFISEYMVVVELSCLHRKIVSARYVVLFCDAVDPEALRQLRVLLCLNQPAKPASSVVSE